MLFETIRVLDCGSQENELRNSVVELIKKGVSKKQAILEVSKKFNTSRRDVYESVVDIHIKLK